MPPRISYCMLIDEHVQIVNNLLLLITVPSEIYTSGLLFFLSSVPIEAATIAANTNTAITMYLGFIL